VSRGRAKTLVVLRAGWPFALRASAYRTFFRRGLRVAVVDRPRNSGLRIADDAIVADLRDTDAVLGALRDRLDLDDVVGVVTFNDGAVPAAARLARLLGLPGLDPEVAEHACDKVVQRQRLAEAGLLVPEAHVALSADEAAEAWAKLGVAIVKPADSTASNEVRLVKNAADARDAYAAAARRSSSGRILVESVLEGPEVAVETIAVAGSHRFLGMSDTTIGGEPFFIELGHATPSIHSGKAEIVDHVIRALRALGIDHGLIHTEVKLTPAGPAVVEVNPRPAGDAIMDLLSLSLGQDVHELLVDVMTGVPIGQIPTTPVRAAAIAFVLNPVGRVQSIEVGKPVLPAAPPWLVDFAVWARAGDVLAAARSSRGRAGYAIAVAETTNEALRRAQSALAAVKLRTEAASA